MQQPYWVYENDTPEKYQKRQDTLQWYHDNFQKINDVFLRYIDQGIGWIPVSNIIPEIKEYDEEFLSRILKDDGIKTRYDNNGVSVYL